MKTIKPLPSFETVDSLLSYNEETGDFVWKVTVSRGRQAGSSAGSENTSGYKVIGIQGEVYLAHRLAWLLSVGDDPEDYLIDHIDENKSNNRIDNLRLIKNGANVAMRRREPKCCIKQRSGRYQAVYTLDGVKHHLGTYDTEEEASKIGREARRKARAI